MRKKKTKRWGRWYAISGAIAEGGQGRLYPVRDSTKSHEEIFVLKELKNLRRAVRFEQEIKAISLLVPHPNVVELVDSGIYRDSAKPWYVMPLAKCSLHEYVTNITGDFERIFAVFDDICAGVGHLHSAGIVHRDLKPGNILMFKFVAKVSDLGLCLLRNTPRITSSPEVVGPRFYMAPEFEDGKCLDVDATADIYSIGKILYYLLSGGKVFAREKYMNREYNLSKILNDPRFRIFESIFRQTITVAKRNRFSDVTELQQEFRDASEQFLNHPRTSLISKLGPIDHMLDSRIDPKHLMSLREDEWKELLEVMQSRGSIPSKEFLFTAAECVSKTTVEPLARLLLDNEEKLDIEIIRQISSRIILIGEDGATLDLWLGIERITRLIEYALDTNDPKVADAVACLSLLILRRNDRVLSKLAKHFHGLTPLGQRNFLAASYDTTYPGKLESLLCLLDSNLDLLSFEAVIAGLCMTADDSALKRVISIGDSLENTERIEAFGRGIALGARGASLTFLSKHNWKHRLLSVLFDILNKANKHNSDQTSNSEPTPDIED